MRHTDLCFLFLAALCLVCGMALGIAMGLSQDFSLRPVHGHLNLLGWATLALFGLAHRAWPELGRSALALPHLVLSGAGGVLLPAGIWLAVTRDQLGLAIAGGVLSFAGALVFLAAVAGLAARTARAPRGGEAARAVVTG